MHAIVVDCFGEGVELPGSSRLSAMPGWATARSKVLKVVRDRDIENPGDLDAGRLRTVPGLSSVTTY